MATERASRAPEGDGKRPPPMNVAAAIRYNRSRAGSLWLASELPTLLAASGAPDSETFAEAVSAFQHAMGLQGDGKLGPASWEAIRTSLRLDGPEPEPEPPPRAPELADVAVDTEEEALARVRAGMALSPHVRELADAYVDVLAGRIDEARARALYRAMRRDGMKVAADVQRRGGKDAELAYAYKGRTAAEMRRSYSKRWHKWLSETKRYGLGVHWTAGTGGAWRAAKYLLATKPGRVSTNAFLDYDGSVFIVYPTVLDSGIEDNELIYTAHGAHNPGCIGVDFASPGMVERSGGGWRGKYGGKLRDDIVAACGVVELDLEHRKWSGEPTPATPWVNRGEDGTVWSARYFLAPTWEQIAGLVVMARVHSVLHHWTEADLVVVGHYQRSSSRADPFYYPLGWIRRDALALEANLVCPSAWLARVNPADVGELVREYRVWAKPLGW